MSYRRVQNDNDDITLYGSVARYGPQSVASATLVETKWIVV